MKGQSEPDMSEAAKLAEYFKMPEAEKLFNEVAARCFDRR